MTRSGKASRTRPPALVGWLVVLAFLAALSNSLVLPAYLGYDEPQHVDAVLALASGDGWAAPGERMLGLGVARSAGLYTGEQRRQRPLDVALDGVAPRDERPTLEQLGGQAPGGGLPNQIVQHPPLYYGLLAGVLRAFGAQDWSYDGVVALLRATTALLVSPLPLLVWATAHRLGAERRVAISAAALSLAVPALSRIAGLVNNDGFLVVTTAALLLALVHVATGRTSLRFAAAVGLLTGAALLAKGFALPLPLLVVLAYGLAARAGPGRAQRVLAPMAVALVVGFVTGGLWWVRNVLLYGTLQPSGFGPEATVRINGAPRPPGDPILYDVYWEALHNRFALTFWGGTGPAADPTTTKLGGTLLFAIVGLSMLVALVVGVRRTRQRALLALLLLPLPLSLAIVVQGSLAAYMEFPRLPGLQGRYIFAAVPGLAVVTAIAWDRLLGPARRVLPPLAVLAMLLLQALHAHRLVRDLWLPPGTGGSLREALTRLEVVAPWPRLAVEAVFGVTALAALMVLALAVVHAVRNDPDDAQPGGEPPVGVGAAEEPAPGAQAEPVPSPSPRI